MYIQYAGFSTNSNFHTYNFDVIDPPAPVREFTVKIRFEDFWPGRLKFQDGPSIASTRLERELKGKTSNLPVEAHLRVEEQDIREYRAEHYPQQKVPKATDALQRISPGSPPPAGHFQNRGYSPLGPTRLPDQEEISTLLLHEAGDSRDGLKLALEGQSVNVRCLRSRQEALPLLTGPNPPHLVFVQPELSDGSWADIVSVALKAQKPVNVIIVDRLSNVGLYLRTITGGAFDYVVPPLTGYELTHVVRCAIENVLCRREAQARSA